jgi:hypothetical protein
MKSNSGNVLFLILIAVALFAALSYAVTTSSRGGGASATKEEDALQAAQITQLGASLKSAVLRESMIGTSIDSIVTNTPANRPYAGGGSLNSQADYCTTGSTCLFAPEGAGVNIPQAPRTAFLPTMSSTMTAWGWTSYFAGATSFNGLVFSGLSPGAAPSNWSIQDIGTAAADDIIQMYPLRRGVCEAINKSLSISGIPNMGYNASPLTVTAGKAFACVNFGDNETFIYYHVLSEN